MQSDYSLGACNWCLHSARTNLSSHTGRHNKQVLYSTAGNAKYILKKIQQYFHTNLTRMTDTILQMCNITVHSFQVLGHYSFFSRPWTLFLSRPWTLFLSLSFSRGPLSASNYFPSYVSLHSTSSFNLVDSLRPRLPRCASTSCLQYICAVSAPQVQPPVLAATYNTVSMSLSS